jgi:hypothetical protein
VTGASLVSSMTQQVYGLPPPEHPEPDRTPVATIALVAGLVVVALAFVIAGIGFVAGWWGPKHEPEPEPAPAVAKQPEIAPEPAPVELAGAELMPTIADRPKVEAVDDTDPFAGAEPVPEIAPRGKAGPAASAGSSGEAGDGSATNPDGTIKARPRVRVAFVLGSHYERVELKLGGKVVKLAGDKTIDLPPGGYRVELRKGPEAPWSAAGLITLELGSKYKVTLLDPPLAKLEVVK